MVLSVKPKYIGTKPMVLEERKSNLNTFFKEIIMKKNNSKPKFVVCIKNKDYSASLELLKIYQVLADDYASEHRYIRVIDESGEDYLYPADFFVPIEVPQAVEKVFSFAT